HPDRHSHPERLGAPAWPRMRLGRLDGGRLFAAKAIASPDGWQRSMGFNALCAVEGEAGKRAPYREACFAALAHARTRRAQGEEAPRAVHAYNAGLAALSVGDVGAAEDAVVGGATRLEFTPATPSPALRPGYWSAGRATEA